jgi:hypothetical protein
MRLFRRRDDEPVDPDERSPQLGLKCKDLAVLGHPIDVAANLSESCHVVFYSYAPSADVGRAMRRGAESQGFETEVREPLPEFPGQWAVVSETNAVASPDFVRDAVDFVEERARRHGAEYDGWEARSDPGVGTSGWLWTKSSFQLTLGVRLV